MNIGISPGGATVPYRVAAKWPLGRAGAGAHRSIMWMERALLRGWGKRVSDRGGPAPAAPRRDRALEAALAADEMEIRFQPQIAPDSGTVRGVEALARWNGAAGAEALFARAAAAGLTERLSRTIQRKALQTAGRWTGRLAELRISVNLLPCDLDRAGFEDWFLGEIAAAGLDPERVTAEIVESALLCDRPAVASRLERLRAHGVSIAVDDFGTGYANLVYLTSLPLDAIKIDRAMVADLVGQRRDRIVVRAMMAMAHELGLAVVVEGVESLGQLELLAEWGCDLYQGFLGAGALDERELAQFVAASDGLAVAA